MYRLGGGEVKHAFNDTFFDGGLINAFLSRITLMSALTYKMIPTYCYQQELSGSPLVIFLLLDFLFKLNVFGVIKVLAFVINICRGCKTG